MGYLFTSESVSEGHPDKVCDQISDALLDEFLRIHPNSKVACETLATTGLVVCSGEIKTEGYVDISKIVRHVIRDIGYTKSEYKFDADSCGILSSIDEQSTDINQGVDRGEEEKQGAGDQGMMFGYAVKEMDNYMPLPIELAHILVQELAAIRKEGEHMHYLRPDSKSQVTVEYDENNKPVGIKTIVISTQHDDMNTTDEEMQRIIREDVIKYLFPRAKAGLADHLKPLLDSVSEIHINPTGKFVIGGPHGDTGLTGRKIIVDTYGGKGAHGGGAFSGKDPSKVDRSAAYAARHIAKNMVAAGVADEIQVQIAYAIGVAEPVGVYVHTYGTCKLKDSNGKVLDDWKIAAKIQEIFDLRPFAIIKRFKLKNPIFRETAAYGHFGRDPHTAEVEVYYENGDTYTRMVDGQKKFFKKAEFFAWEKLDYVDEIKKAFGI